MQNNIKEVSTNNNKKKTLLFKLKNIIKNLLKKFKINLKDLLLMKDKYQCNHRMIKE